MIEEEVVVVEAMIACECVLKMRELKFENENEIMIDFRLRPRLYRPPGWRRRHTTRPIRLFKKLLEVPGIFPC
jgi:hypothetical protein